MEEDTAVANPTDELPEVQDETQELQIDGVESGTFLTTIKTATKGKAKGKTQLIIIPNVDESLESLHKRLRTVVGPENWDKCVQAMVRQACIDSTNQAIKDHKEGKLTDTGFSSAYVSWHLPATRRSGVHIKDLREKAQELYSELNPLLTRHFKFKQGEVGALDESEHNRMIQLTMEYSDIQAKIEEKSRKGKKD